MSNEADLAVESTVVKVVETIGFGASVRGSIGLRLRKEIRRADV